MVSIFAGSMPAAFMFFAAMRPVVDCTCPPVPESNMTYLPFILTTVIVKGIGMMLSRRLDLIGLRIFHKIVFERTVPDPVVDLGDFDIAKLELVKALIDELGVGVGLGLAEPMNSSGPLRPNAAEAA